jgi:hypothetical protein
MVLRTPSTEPLEYPVAPAAFVLDRVPEEQLGPCTIFDSAGQEEGRTSAASD